MSDGYIYETIVGRSDVPLQYSMFYEMLNIFSEFQLCLISV